MPGDFRASRKVRITPPSAPPPAAAAGRLPELPLVQPRVQPAQRQQLPVRSPPPRSAHDPAPRSRSARCTVLSRCAMISVVRPTSSFAERVLDQPLALGVQVAGGLVEDQHRGVLEDRARDRHPLALAAGQLHAPLPDQGVVAAAGSRSTNSCACAARAAASTSAAVASGRAYAMFSRIVPLNSAGSCGHDPDGAAQVGQAERADVDAVERDPAPVHVPEPRQQRDQRGLAAARRPHQRHHLARRARSG